MANKIVENTVKFGAALIQALADSHTRARQMGYDEGYQQGWEDATEAMLAAAVDRRKSVQAVVPREIIVPLEGTLRAKITAVVKAHPGMRPSEVAHWLRSKDPTINHNSVLVTIKRMRADNAFEEREMNSKLFIAATEAA